MLPLEEVPVQYQFDGSLFNIRRFKARTKVSSNQIIELQYTDECAIVAQDAATLQNMLNTLIFFYSVLGLKINAQKRKEKKY